MTTLSAITQKGERILEFAADRADANHYQEMGAEGAYGSCRFRFVDCGKGELWTIKYDCNEGFFLQVSCSMSRLICLLEAGLPAGSALLQITGGAVLRSGLLQGSGESVVIVLPEDHPLLRDSPVVPVFSDKPVPFPEGSAILSSVLGHPADSPWLKTFMTLKCDEFCLLLLQKAVKDSRERFPEGVAAKLGRVAELIREQPERNYQIKELAKLVQLNETDLKRHFKRRYGVTVHDYSLSVKMQEAMHLLLHSRDKVKGIAAALGFGSESGFSGSFRKYFGQTPGDVRKGRKGG